jgi:4-alpha-glucanotransferase
MHPRGNGILLHVSSLSSPFGIGDLGPAAYQFIDFLSASGQQYWQILPLNPTGTYLGNSPYTSYSVFAGNPLFISLESLHQFDLIAKENLQDVPSFALDHVDYDRVVPWKAEMLRRVFDHAEMRMPHDKDFADFCEKNAHWLEDFSLFAALKDEFQGIAWNEWPVAIRDREEVELSKWKIKLERRILRSKFLQYVFFKQWQMLREYAAKKNIKIIGDIPIYPSMDSSDAWSHPELFKLDAEKHPLYVAGAPPDYFSETGQRWGNPVYRWEELDRSGYAWWIERIKQNLKFCDLVRLDHFRGFVAYWEIPTEEETAVKGEWVRVDAKRFFEALNKKFSSLPLILEDLGHITQDVRDVMDALGFPGMKVLLFAFGSDVGTNPYAPHNYVRNCVVYTGTHDNNTIRGWFENEASDADKKRLQDYVGHLLHPKNVSAAVIRLAMSSVARICILPLQDVLGLGEEARMNVPSESNGNWKWRVRQDQLTKTVAESLLAATRLYGRLS